MLFLARSPKVVSPVPKTQLKFWKMNGEIKFFSRLRHFIICLN
jgi:hypothetical protein